MKWKLTFYQSVGNVCHEFRNTPFLHHANFILYDPKTEQASIVTVLNLFWHIGFLYVCSSKIYSMIPDEKKVLIAIKNGENNQ